MFLFDRIIQDSWCFVNESRGGAGNGAPPKGVRPLCPSCSSWFYPFPRPREAGSSAGGPLVSFVVRRDTPFTTKSTKHTKPCVPEKKKRRFRQDNRIHGIILSILFILSKFRLCVLCALCGEFPGDRGLLFALKKLWHFPSAVVNFARVLDRFFPERVQRNPDSGGY